MSAGQHQVALGKQVCYPFSCALHCIDAARSQPCNRRRAGHSVECGVVRGSTKILDNKDRRTNHKPRRKGRAHAATNYHTISHAKRLYTRRPSGSPTPPVSVPSGSHEPRLGLTRLAAVRLLLVRVQGWGHDPTNVTVTPGILWGFVVVECRHYTTDR